MPRTRGSDRRLPGVRPGLLAVAVLVLVASVAGTPVGRHARAAPEPSSIVVIMTDDQRWDTLWAMPTVRSELVDKGVTFTNAFVSNALCCPSRASALTGAYSHTTGVWRNEPPYGGWASFNDTSTIATWLREAGYRTGFFGKYLNGYWTPAYETGYVPPGWDRWVAFARSGYFEYDLNVDGTIRHHGSRPQDYSTRVLADEAASFIRSEPGPILVWFTPYAPHGPATPEPRYADAFSDLSPWRPPSYNERDVSDKPSWLQTKRRLDRGARARTDAFRIDQYRALLSVDDAVGTILDALRDTGRLSTTLVVFMSDNGMLWGEHRWKAKRVAYEEAIRIPFVVRYDPLIERPRVDPSLVLNIDVAPTAAELAGVEAPGAEGASILSLLANPSAAWRKDFLLEHLEKNERRDRVPAYCGVRTERYTYVLYGTGETELYDLDADPYQLTNLAGAPEVAAEQHRLHARVLALCDPPPPGFAPTAP
ncbi:MAG: hypothetical protein KatS3mg013_1979 [Actinomycetota bacterium]|nr:MAG: hypothetical protein KatS3mg013_1979 [Actinomycetota bacterium]